MHTSVPPQHACRLRVEGLKKSFDGVQVLNGIDFDVAAGEVLGVVGENGSGKSTIMNIVGGVISRDAGSIFLDGEIYSPRSRRESSIEGVAFIQQELNIFGNLSVSENLFLGRSPRVVQGLPFLSRKKRTARAFELLRSVDLKVNSSLSASLLSPGERQLLEIARGLSTEARVMIFDEPTTSLTAWEAARLFEIIIRLRERGVTILYISHNLEDVLRLSDQILVVRDGTITMRTPNIDITPDRLIRAMVGRSIEALFPPRTPCPTDAPLVLEVDEVGEPGVVEAMSFQIKQGEIVGLAGLLGSGRTELARILFGLDSHQRGAVRMNGHVLPPGHVRSRLDQGIAFLTEDRRHEGVMMDASVWDNMALAALPMFARRGDGRIRTRILSDAMKALAIRLKLKSGTNQNTAVRTLSGGNQQKVVLGRWLLRNPTLFILDEPTRGVDVGAKEEIYRLLSEMAANQMAILVISSEVEELIGLCDRILVMRRGRIRAEFRRQDFDRESILRAAFGHETAS